MADPTICPCDDEPAQFTISNLPGLDQIVYRIGDFNSFRHALLQSLTDPPGPEQQLSIWQPTADGDLGLQMLEWWAYIGDILTFYNERVANETYLRTATLPQSVRQIIRTIGYRPRPGIGARGQLVALAGGHRDFTLPAGFSVDSKPGPGESPQTFELDADTVVSPLVTQLADVPAYVFAPSATSFLVVGTKVPFAAGDVLLVRSLSGAFDPVLVTAQSVRIETGEDGKPRTRVTLAAPVTISPAPSAKDVEVHYATQNAAVWSEYGSLSVTPACVHLASVARDLHAGDYFVLTAPGHTSEMHYLDSIADVIWYANHDSNTLPDQPPKDKTTIPIPVIHSRLNVDSVGSYWVLLFEVTTVRYGWRSVGQLLDQPVLSFNGTPGTLNARAPAAFPSVLGKTVIVADANGEGMTALASTSNAGTVLTLSNLPVPPASLTTPLTAHFNILGMSRGKTVPTEVLGSGDATVAGQEFVLKKSPITYLAKGDGQMSTLAVRVNDRLWDEVPSFYQQDPKAEIFVTYEDEDQKTHVQFGDGVNGARIPTGANNVTATYRYGSGAASPLSAELTVINKPFPNLKSVLNPVAVGGGADPDPPDQIRRFAPPTVLTFGRAISGDDYESIAGRAPGVTRAQALWSFDAAEQRAAVKIYVGDDPAAVTSATQAITAAGDPYRHVVVTAATPIPIGLSLHLLIDPKALADDVVAAVTSALLDDYAGLFGAHRLAIGDAVFDSQISQACLSCPDAIALHGLVFENRSAGSVFETQPRHAPGEGAFYLLDPAQLNITTEADAHGG